MPLVRGCVLSIVIRIIKSNVPSVGLLCLGPFSDEGPTRLRSKR